jgi:hypothetical protein
MDRIDVTSTSRQSALCSDIVVRDLDTVRLVFRPEIVDNPKEPAACIRGTFLYQRKGKNDGWDDAPYSSLSSLKKGEGYQVELKSGELLPLLHQLGSLYRLHRKQGVPQGRQHFVRMEEQLAQLLHLGEDELNEFLNAHPADAVLTLRKVLRWLSNSTALAGFIVNDTEQIAVLNAVLGVAVLRAVLGIWEQESTNGAEEFWQQTLSDHAFVLSQLYAYPIIVIGEKAYVGGKRLDNRHGNLADFLARAQTSGNPLIIEIKTPTTGLLGPVYRDEAFPLSHELSGAIAQVLKYRDSLAESVRHLSAADEVPMLGTEPRCLIIAGNFESLDSTAKRKSFERFRERLTGVTIVTFDELFERVHQLEALMTPPAS